MIDRNFVAMTFAAAAAVGMATFVMAPYLEAMWRTATLPSAERAAIEATIHYPGCDAVRQAGAAPLYKGSPGYRPGMDGDGDGIACEPYGPGGAGLAEFGRNSRRHRR